jgi:hypothetical protein
VRTRRGRIGERGEWRTRRRGEGRQTRFERLVAGSEARHLKTQFDEHFGSDRGGRLHASPRESVEGA